MNPIPLIDTAPPPPLPPQWQQWAPDYSGAADSPNTTPTPSEAAHSVPGQDRDFLEFAPTPRADIPNIWEFPNNDDGRAAYLLAHFGEILRYVPELGQWRIWHGQRWHPDTTGRAGHYCQLLSRHQLEAATCRMEELANELSSQIKAETDPVGGSKAGRKLKRADVEAEARRNRACATALGNEKTISAMLAAASRVGHVIVPLVQWDANPWLVGTANGRLNLSDQTHAPGIPVDYMTRGLAVAYDPRATAPQWEAFIARILPDDSLAHYVQTIAGRSLTGSTDDQAFYFLYGTGKNGKSIFIETIAALFNDYAGKARRNLIEEPRNGGDCKHDLAQLPGIRLLHGEETSSGGRLREDVVKSLTAGDTLTGEAKYHAPFSFHPCAKLWLMGNHKPRIEGTDTGIWRRVRMIPFTATISDEEEIPQAILMARFAAERPGILNWMLAGLAACPSGSIAMPPAVRDAVAEYRQSEDDLGDFISECTQDATENYKESKQDVFRAYQRWAADNGISRPWTMKQFTRRLSNREGWRLDPRGKSWMEKSVISDAC